MPNHFSSSPTSTNLHHQPTSMINEPSCPEDACIHDMDNFIATLTTFKSQHVQPDELIASIISHYATKWLPHFSQQKSSSNTTTTNPTSSWIKKRFFLQTLIDFLPQESPIITSTFLLKLLKVANMVGLEQPYLSQIEQRVAFKLDQATIKELMIPCFNHTCVTLLDIDLVHRLVKIFVEINESCKSGSGCELALAKVAKLIDSYLAEVALDGNVYVSQFVELATALPQNARGVHDGLYRAIDTYLKAHPNVTKQERRTLCNIIDSQKLSQEASIHAAQNDRLPVRSVIQVLFSEQTKLNHQLEWTGSFSGPRSPLTMTSSLEPTTRCNSKRVITTVPMSSEQVEMLRLKEEVLRLQKQCDLFQEQIEMMLLEKKKSGFNFKWRKLSLVGYFRNGSVVEKGEDTTAFGGCKGSVEIGTPMVVRGRTPSRWRTSLS